MKRILFLILVLIPLIQWAATSSGDIKVICQVTGPINTNCYLIYDTQSKEAALIDPGWQVDKLTNYIRENDLLLKYIFITHGHIDHFYYVPEIKKHYPVAKLCMHKDDYEDTFTAIKWLTENYGQEWIDEANSEPDTKALLDFDMNLLGVPDIFAEGSQTFKLGSVEIKTIYSPGHSPGGICYYTGNILFSGDVLFYRSVGRTDTQHGSREAQLSTVRKLYELFPDSTLVYPGHGQYTDIGSEKRDNPRITVDGGSWDTK